MSISDYRKIWHPLHKISLVFFGILLIPLLGLGVFMIIAGTNKGPMMQATEIVEAKGEEELGKPTTEAVNTWSTCCVQISKKFNFWSPTRTRISRQMERLCVNCPALPTYRFDET